MKLEIVKDGTGMCWIAFCEGLYDSGRNVVSGPAADKETVIAGAFNELLKIIEENKKAKEE